MKKSVNHGIFVLILFFGSALVVLTVAIVASIMMKSAAEFLRSNIEARLLAASRTASYLIKPEELAQLVSAEDMERPLYAEVKNRLIAFGKEHDILFVYYMRPGGEPDMMQFIVDNDITEKAVGLATPLQNAEPAPKIALEGMPASAGLGNYSAGYTGMLSAFSPVFDGNGRVVAVAGVDITDEQVIVMRNGIYVLTALLLISVTAAVASGYAGFAQYRKKAAQSEAASISKSIFLANMSHEMRTPMNAIVGMTNIARTSSDVEQKNYCLDKIEDASSHLLGVINDILDISKIEAGKFELAHAEFNFEKMLHRVADVVTSRIEEKRQNFFVHIDRDIPASLIGDEQHLAQVVANLLSNAAKFTPEQGAIRLEACLRERENGVCSVQIAVSDTGIGISGEQKDRLFHPFVQANSNISGKFGGTGLGLVISKRIVEMMGGRIWIDSEVGKGTTFAFTVRVEQGGDAPRRIAAAEGDPPQLLVVDESLEIREYCRDIAERLGLVCDVAANGEEALGLLKRRNARYVCFVDWKTPGMDGMALPRRIKELRADIAVVLVTPAAAWSRLEPEAKEAGIASYLSKPIFPGVVADRILECLGVHPPPAQTETAFGEPACFAGRRMLLVEDVEINREIMLELLKNTSLEIECAVNGAEAVRLFRKRAEDYYNLILMDVQMPEMNGYEATRSIRSCEKPEGRRVPIIAMTANVFHEDIEKCLKAGMDGHLGKPINLAEVLAVLHKYL
ncbi:MAG: response regulator [Desulfovibrio sp.]|jgi:signal transduction histidine kinase/DNA-binding response OmpR family regulator|nr:response regulator [Desulfovibrio sp.]